MIKYRCPVCAFGMDDPPEDYNICPCCGTEFGNNDVNASVAELRLAWLKTGLAWWSPISGPPADWDAYGQLNSMIGQSPLWLNYPLIGESSTHGNEEVSNVKSNEGPTKQVNATAASQSGATTGQSGYRDIDHKFREIRGALKAA